MLKKILIPLTMVLTLSSVFVANAGTRILLVTNLGGIALELDDDNAPITSKNFINYVNSGFYAGTIFHRTIPGFMIQGGGFTADMQQKKTNAPIQNEATNGLKNLRGTIAMARTNDINSATSQFFINVVDNNSLNNSSTNYGYAVFGKVVNGMDIVDKIVALPTHRLGGHGNIPNETVTILSAQVIKQ